MPQKQKSTVLAVIKIFSNHIIPNIWPLNSPDRNPPWLLSVGVVEQETNKILRNTKDELKARITATFSNLNTETVRKAFKRFRSRLEALVDESGEFLKN